MIIFLKSFIIHICVEYTSHDSILIGIVNITAASTEVKRSNRCITKKTIKFDAYIKVFNKNYENHENHEVITHQTNILIFNTNNSHRS